MICPFGRLFIPVPGKDITAGKFIPCGFIYSTPDVASEGGIRLIYVFVCAWHAGTVCITTRSNNKMFVCKNTFRSRQLHRPCKARDVSCRFYLPYPDCPNPACRNRPLCHALPCRHLPQKRIFPRLLSQP